MKLFDVSVSGFFEAETPEQAAGKKSEILRPKDLHSSSRAVHNGDMHNTTATTIKTKRLAAGEYLTTGHAGPSYRIERFWHGGSHGRDVTLWSVFAFGSEFPIEAFDTKADAVAWLDRFLR